MLKILYLEDDEMVARGVVRRLEQDGYSVELVTTGENALEATRNESYSMLLLDWDVADALTGVDVCRERRARGTPRKRERKKAIACAPVRSKKTSSKTLDLKNA